MHGEAFPNESIKFDVADWWLEYSIMVNNHWRPGDIVPRCSEMPGRPARTRPDCPGYIEMSGRRLLRNVRVPAT